jgi:RimJ/RimL family protein N-acetyltransferase
VADDSSSRQRLRLYTERLCLRMPTLGDAEALYDLFADLGIMQALGKEPVSSLEEARVMTEDGIAGWRTGGSWPFVLETASADRRVVGQAGLMIARQRPLRTRCGETWCDTCRNCDAFRFRANSCGLEISAFDLMPLASHLESSGRPGLLGDH